MYRVPVLNTCEHDVPQDATETPLQSASAPQCAQSAVRHHACRSERHKTRQQQNDAERPRTTSKLTRARVTRTVTRSCAQYMYDTTPDMVDMHALTERP